MRVCILMIRLLHLNWVCLCKPHVLTNVTIISLLHNNIPDMESKLMRLASEFNFDFERVANSLGDEHGSKHIAFDKESCFRRWSLLDLSAEEEAVVVKEKEDEFECECSQTDKVCLMTCGFFFVHMICTYLLTSLSLSTFLLV